MDFDQTLEHLQEEGKSLQSAALYNLSKIDAGELEHLKDVWPLIPTARRLAMVQELVEIAETNFEVYFDPIFRWGLQDNDEEIRALSVEGLWENEELGLMNELLDLLKDDPSDLVRAAAASCSRPISSITITSGL